MYNVYIINYIKDLKRYYAQYLPYVATQPPSRDDLVASILEKNYVEFSAQQEWENEWNQAGLASRLSEQVWIQIWWIPLMLDNFLLAI